MRFTAAGLATMGAACGAISITVREPAPDAPTAPIDLTLPSTAGDVAVASGPAVLVFYRGFW